MDEPTHVIDPDGEVIIVLKDANLPFAVWPDEGPADEQSLQQSETGKETEEQCFRIKVSAKHLASPVFKACLLGGWNESSTFLENGSTTLTVSGWDLEAFLIVMRIIHSQNNQLPRRVSLELFAKITVIVDYYKCKDAIAFFSDIWLDDLESKSDLHLAGAFSRDHMLWMWVSWVFRRDGIFRRSTAVALKYSKIHISSLGLPLSTKLIYQLNVDRERGIE
ncbi:hypothetical protein TMatcc_008004 [Talaromyces marneffei ATCC 18224]|uniref:BTB domain-containing protein n=2 Tax=Talaromyces marneffei TaxID=37727 RepID=B6QE58_TALMQ|nr:conserved hypothetical protein [Talaromyces marneffei ATCC 18224]